MSSVHLGGGLADRSAWTPTECSIGKAMEAIGSRASMLLIREAFYGTTRFDDFASRVGITQASAAARLKQLTELGILERRPYREPGQRTRHEYVLTEMGLALLPTFVALMKWGDTYLQNGRGAPLVLSEDGTEESVDVAVTTESGRVLAPSDLRLRPAERYRRKARRASARKPSAG